MLSKTKRQLPPLSLPASSVRSRERECHPPIFSPIGDSFVLIGQDTVVKDKLETEAALDVPTHLETSGNVRMVLIY